MVRVPGTEDARRIAQTIPTSWNGVIRLALGALVVVFCLLSTAALAAQTAEQPPARPAASAPTSYGKPIVLPFHLSDDGLILIDGKVDGTRGVFIFDTGMPFRFLLNRHYVSLGQGVTVNQGHVASGQSMVIQSHSGARSIQLAKVTRFSAANGSHYGDPEAVMSADFGFIEKAVAPRFLGMIGWELLKNYEFVLDYERKTIVLYPLVPDGAPHISPATRSGKSLVIHFRPSSPPEPFTLDVNGVTLPAVLDTGGHERLAAPAATWARLTSGGPLETRRDGDDEEVSLKLARYRDDNFDLPDLQKVISDKTLVTLGYPFLRRYRSTWNISLGVVTLEPN